jgi:hypothetical protein
VSGLDGRYAVNDTGFARDVERIRPQDHLRARQSFWRDIDNYGALAVLREKRRGGSTNASAAAGHKHNAVFGGHGCLSSPLGLNNPRAMRFS